MNGQTVEMANVPDRTRLTLDVVRQLEIIALAEALVNARRIEDEESHDYFIEQIARSAASSGEYEVARSIAREAKESQVTASLEASFARQETDSATEENDEVFVPEPTDPERDTNRWLEIATLFGSPREEDGTVAAIADLIPTDDMTGLELFQTVLEAETA
jgi:hypothetical protein